MRTLFLTPLIALATGCTLFTPQWEGVWYIQVPVEATEPCPDEVSHNYDDVDEIDFDVDSDWTLTQETVVSDSAFFIEIINGKGGEVFAIFNGEVYPGTADKNVLTVSWNGLTDSDTTQEHVDDYYYSRSSFTEVIETITLTRTANGVATGNTEAVVSDITEYLESDRWRTNQVPLAYSQIPSTQWLEGNDSFNVPDSNQCDDDECRITITNNCTFSSDFTAKFAGKYENGFFAGVEDVKQNPGAF